MTIQTKTGSRKSKWKQDPEAVQADILRVATQEFAANGFSGCRVDEIARKTEASKRMLYYYFGDKEGIYLRVLEGVYAKVRAGENALELDELDPVKALSKLVEFSFDYHKNNPDFVRLIAVENIREAKFIAQSKHLRSVNNTVIEKLEGVCKRGIAEGFFHPDLNTLELHWMISALSFYNVSNENTFVVNFGKKIHSDDGQIQLKKHVVRLILLAVLIDAAPHIGE